MYPLRDLCHQHHPHLKMHWRQCVYRVVPCGAVVDGGASGPRRAADTAALRLVSASPTHDRA